MDIDAVIINYKSRDALAKCLLALAQDAAAHVDPGAPETPEAGRARPLSIGRVVVDNDSRDGTSEMLAERFPEVRLISNRENVGYARAVNQGIAATTAPFVLVMNPDCEPRPGAVRRLREHLLAHPHVALAGPRILNTDGTLEYSARSFPTPFTFLFNRYSLLTRLFPDNRWTKVYLLSDWDHTSSREVDWLSGACLMARRAAIDRVGGMDEAFFMFNEDVDWCRRMWREGWSNAYVADAEVVHHIGASKSKVAPRVIWARHLGMIHYFRKHHPTFFLFEWLGAALILARGLLMLVANAMRRG